jgi:hypothetical protein
VASDQAASGPGDTRHLASNYGDDSSKKPSTTSLTGRPDRAGETGRRAFGSCFAVVWITPGAIR